MKVSVIIATYRRDDSLKKAIESLKNQTYKDTEIIVVDDNADKTWNEKVAGIIAEFDGIRYIKNETNKGSAETRNIGIAAASGDYITFLDDDDLYLPEKIDHQLTKTVSENADFSVTDLFLYNEQDKLIDKRIRNYIQNTDSDGLLKYHLMHHITGTDTMMFKRDYLLKIGGFAPINVGDEFYLMERAIRGGGKFSYIPGCYIKAYVHTTSDGLSSGQSKIDGENELYEYKKKFFDEIDSKSRRYIQMRHYAVLAFAELRRKKYGSFIKNSILSFIKAPVACIKLFVGIDR